MQIRLWNYIFIVILLILSLEVIALFQLPDKNLHLISCDVGEGDATLLIYKNIQILVDGGPNKKVLSCLGKYLPFWDRDIELVISTHPDKDHFMGLIDVVRNYKVVNFLYNPITVSKPEYRVLENEVGRGGINRLDSLDARKIRFDLIYLDILSPDPAVFKSGLNPSEPILVPDSETNKYSIVNLVSFGNFKALLTGDMTPGVSDDLAESQPNLHAEYIKIPHHGSKNGLTQNLLEILRPDVATISVGKNNYGHPAVEILKMLNEYGVKIMRTDEKGDIEVVTDGNKYWFH